MKNMFQETFYNHNLNCIENIIANIAKSLARNYEMCLADRYSFSYQCVPEKALGCYVNSGSDINCRLLSRFHGIKLDEGAEGIDENSAKFLYELLERKKYVVVFTDTYECPWDKNYNIYHNYNHAIVVHGYNSKGFWVSDPFYKVINNFFPKEKFFAATSKFFSVDIKENYETFNKHFYVKSLFECGQRMETKFEELYRFFERLKDINPNLEIGNLKNPWHSPLVFNMGRIGLARRAYSEYIKYGIKNGLHSDGLNKIIFSLEKSSDLWDLIRSRIVVYLITNDERNLDVIASRYFDLLNEEKEIVKFLKMIKSTG